MNGSIEGQGDLIIDGEGTVAVNTTNFFKFDGNVVMKGGTLKLQQRISLMLVLALLRSS